MLSLVIFAALGFPLESLACQATIPATEEKQSIAYDEAVQWAQQLNQNANAIITKQLSSREPSSGCSKCQVADTFFRKEPTETKKHDTHVDSTQAYDHKLYIFVSFSMPLSVLKTLCAEAERHHAVLVMRGLINDSYKETAAQLSEISGGIEINPTLFKEYRIDRVPTFVLVKKDQEINRLSGNVTLTFAAEKLQEVHS